ncbi:MAG: hypothetical protein NTZ01_06885 [Verrucomicrobia bacterium]|nr:hypothetical protein [Verrucomicrobiota bacterium]
MDASLYFGNFKQYTNALGGTLAVTNSSPVAGVKTIVFQIQIGEAIGHDFYYPTGYPILKINNSTNGISATFDPVLVDRYQNGTIVSPETGQEEPVYVNTWAYQWNLENTTSVSSFAIEFSAVTHAQIYAMQLDQSSVLQTSQLLSQSSEPSPPPQIRLLSVGTPQFDGLNTSMTHTFSGPSSKTIDVEYSGILATSGWSSKTNVSTGDGAFTTTFSASGDQCAAWAQRMFFRAKYSQNP